MTKKPTIYADGIHCDAAGINALLRGEEVTYASPEIQAAIHWDGTTFSSDVPLTTMASITLTSGQQMGSMRLSGIRIKP